MKFRNMREVRRCAGGETRRRDDGMVEVFCPNGHWTETGIHMSPTAIWRGNITLSCRICGERFTFSGDVQ